MTKIEVPDELVHIINDVLFELDKGQRRFPPMVSLHQGYAIIQKEMDELWEEVKDNKRLPEDYRDYLDREARQVAAMAIRFMHDVSQKRDLMQRAKGH